MCPAGRQGAIRATGAMRGIASAYRWRRGPARSWPWQGHPTWTMGTRSSPTGRAVGSFGDFSGSPPMVYYTQPKMFPLPQPAERQSRLVHAGVGLQGLDGAEHPGQPTRCGRLAHCAGAGRGRRGDGRLPDALAGTGPLYALYALEALLFALLAVVAFSLMLFDRSDRVYLWMGAVLLLLAANNGVGALAVLDAAPEHIDRHA